jgi:hypothetical protein
MLVVTLPDAQIVEATIKAIAGFHRWLPSSCFHGNGGSFSFGGS